MKVLVTGATGFIGSAITRELIKEGQEIKVLIRKNSNTRNIDGLDISSCRQVFPLKSGYFFIHNHR